VRSGKLAPDLLRRLVLGRLGIRRPDVLVHAALGEDAAAVAAGADEALVLTSDPITGAAANAGWYAVHVNCNDLAAMGAQPIGVLATLLLPESVEENDIAALVADIDRAARELGIEVLGGHTEVAPGLSSPLIAMTAVGRAPRARLLASANARPGHQLVLTKAAGLEGTAILATDLAEYLADRLPPDVLARARGFLAELSVVPEGLLAAELGAAALHDPTEGGLLGAVWELAEAAGCGFELDLAAVPVRPETHAICAIFGADPLKLIASGALLAAASDGSALAAGLRAAGHQAAVIGRLTNGLERIVIDGTSRRPAGPAGRDELWRIREEWG
jgi:hydrogenase expression/formation protein HypE